MNGRRDLVFKTDKSDETFLEHPLTAIESESQENSCQWWAKGRRWQQLFIQWHSLMPEGTVENQSQFTIVVFQVVRKVPGLLRLPCLLRLELGDLSCFCELVYFGCIDSCLLWVFLWSFLYAPQISSNELDGRLQSGCIQPAQERGSITLNSPNVKLLSSVLKKSYSYSCTWSILDRLTTFSLL